MAYQTNKIQQHKDPFLVQPLPKSFYHPSPTKEVNEREAIRSPQRKKDPTFNQEEGFLRGGPTFKTSALPDIKTLHNLVGSRSELLKQGEKTSYSQLDETLSESESPTSVSGIDTSHVTATTEHSDAASPNIGDIVRGLEGRTHPHRSVHAADNKISNIDSTAGTGEPVLQRYIDRFRTSAPKSREERMKEKGDNLPFWWLQSSPGSRSDSVQARPGESTRQFQNVPESSSEPHVKKQLTKQALLTLDEETYHLQSKADRLLSKSELSLASSGPIVSTVGLGSSTSASSTSFTEDRVVYQPAFVKGEESYHRLESKPFGREGDRARLVHANSNSPADDILTRWRLRRKMEEASTAPSFGHFDSRFPSGRSSRPSVQNSQLEEFRKKILSQKALVTHEDILYERQRMAMMMDDIKQDGSNLSKKISQTAVQHLEPAKDAVLERLQKITGNKYPSRMIIPEVTTPNVEPDSTLPAISTIIDHNFSINNANFSDKGLVRNHQHPLATPILDRNNTASSDCQTPHDSNLNNFQQPEFIVDSFGSQVVCDPKKRDFHLGNSKTESNGDGILDNPGDKGGNDFISGKKIPEMVEDCQGYNPAGSASQVDIAPANFQNGSGKAKIIHESDVDSINGNTPDVKEPQSNRNGISEINNTKNGGVSKEGRNHDGRMEKHANKRVNGDFYQFLEAEKPISELKQSQAIANSKDETITSDYKSKSFRNQRERENAQSLESVKRMGEMEISEDRKRTRDQDKRKHRPKTLGREGESDMTARSEVLADITNEWEHLTEKISKGHVSALPGHRNGSNKISSHESTDMNIYLDKLGRTSGPVTSECSPRNNTARRKASMSRQQQPVKSAIGQTVADHLFDGSTLLSSVDSWASMFAESPDLSHSLHGSTHSTMSSVTPSHRGSTPLESTPVNKTSSNQQVVADDQYESDGEFNEDPLLQILRQRRDLYLQQLKCIEKKLQDTET